jgi:hypothetical protein
MIQRPVSAATVEDGDRHLPGILRCLGKVARSSIGSYSYQKRLKRGKVVVCQVDVFPLEVKRLEKSWPEKGEREVQWFSPTAAAETVSEPVLSDIIRNLPKRL